MKFLAVFAVVVSVAATAEIFRGKPQWDEHWKNYKAKHGKRYNHTVHEAQRRQNWEKTHSHIIKHNEEAANGNHTYTMAENHLSDLHDDEFNALNGARIPEQYGKRAGITGLPVTDRNVPTSTDYRTSSCMPPIANQGSCGSCWAFSATATLGFAVCNKTGTAVRLSEQQLVDCSSSYGNAGCSGGWYVSAWNYVKAAPGQASLSSYPYKAVNGTCSYTSSTSAGTATGSVSYFKTEASIMSAVASQGAVSAALHVVSSFKSYSTGIYTDSTCSSDGKTVNHGVVLVGYGSLNGVNYWIVRNSWGTAWGMQGYAYVQRGVNMCNIESWVAYPTV